MLDIKYKNTNARNKLIKILHKSLDLFCAKRGKNQNCYDVLAITICV